MFGTKLITIAAGVALAIGSATMTTDGARVRVHVRQVEDESADVATETFEITEEALTGSYDDELVDSVDVDGVWSSATGSADDAASGSDYYYEEEDASKEDDYCTGEGQSLISVVGAEGTFCVDEQACVADIDGACPGAQDGLEFGSYCTDLPSGVKGCMPYEDKKHKRKAVVKHVTLSKKGAAKTKVAKKHGQKLAHKKMAHHKGGDVCKGEGVSPMSVEGVEGVYCTYGQACVADIDGSCPGPQHGLEYGAYCGEVKTGVMGCKPYSEDDFIWEDVSTPADWCTGEGESPMSVEGVEGIFCVHGQACVADIDGACPEAQDGLEYGAYCGEVVTGVKGCKPHTEHSLAAWNAAIKHKKSTTSHVKLSKKGAAKKEKGKKAAKHVSRHKAHKKENKIKYSKKDADMCKGDGVSPMSVEGVEGVFCTYGQACVADIDGSCPGAQDGLEYGAYCDVVKTGVMGCKPYTEEDYVWETVEAPADWCSGEGDSPMSVEGVEGIFCVTGQACVADIDGACPVAQYGLEYGAYCGEVVTGVMGCKPHTAETAEAWRAALKN